MDKIVKWAFGLLMGAMIGALLYIIFFGTGSLRTRVFGGSTGNAQIEDWSFGANGYRGVWYYMCQNLETPISCYYYKYCYVPETLSDYYVDSALGVSFADTGLDIDNITADNIYKITADLDGNEVFNTSGANYSTGWY